MIPDLINAAFQLSGGLFVALSIADIYRKKAVAGHTLTTTGFFLSGGFWNLYYFPALGQWWSTVGAYGMCAANVVLTGFIIKYRKAAT